MQILGDIKFPHSLGLLYSAFTYYTGFKVNSAEYKVMGLAPYGEPRYRNLILSELIDLKRDGSFRMNMAFFNYLAGLTMTNRRFHALFGGPPRQPESALTQRDMDLARSIQEVTEEIVLRMARHVRRETGLPRLCLGGGVALNCVANGRLLREGVFDEIWAQPAAGDAGGAIGAAFYAWHQYLGRKRHADGKRDRMAGAFLGPEFSSDEIRACLEAGGVSYRELQEKEIPAVTADLVARQKVVGWFQGRMEFGPRALGARSILGDARSLEMQSRMNLKIKFRENFRPFAPSVLEEAAGDYFSIDRPSPYMLFVAPLRPDRRRPLAAEERELAGLEKLKAARSGIPAVTHVDYSARLHTVSSEANPRFYSVIAKFHADTGCPVLVNTSFNVRGEPIVCAPREALDCFLNTGMDCLVIGNFLVEKEGQSSRPANFSPSIPDHSGWRREMAKLDWSRGALQNFGLIVMLAFAASGIMLIRRAPDYFTPALLAAALSGAIAILDPRLLCPFYRAWMALALLLGRIMTAILLGLFFYLALTPLALALRAFGKKFLDFDWPARGETFWNRRADREPGPEGMERQF